VPVAGLLERAPQEPLRSPRTISWRCRAEAQQNDISEDVGLVGTTRLAIIVISITLGGSSLCWMVVVQANPSGLQIRS
jgi:hypothetical protein